MRIPGHKTILLLLVALSAAALSACGGGGEETETTVATTEEPQQLSKAELIDEGDDVCAEVNAAVGALDSEPEVAAVPETIEKTANLYLGMVERIQDLGSPEGDAAGYADFMEAAEQLAKVEGEVKLAVEREDTAALGEAATAAAPALEEFQTEAGAYGFEECRASPVAPSSTAGTAAGAEGGEEFEGVEEEEGGVEPEAEYVEPEEEAVAPEEEAAPETGGAGGGAAAPESGGGGEAGGTSGGVGPG